MFPDPYKLLDEILLLCKDNDISYNKIEFMVKSKYPNISDNRISNAVDRLIKDKYIDESTKELSREYPKISLLSQEPNITYETIYFITFEGELLIISGGYQKKVADDASENKRLRDMENFQSKQSQKMSRLTFWIAVGTLIAAVYYLLQIWISLKGK